MQKVKEKGTDEKYKKFMFNRRFDQTSEEVRHAEEDIAEILHTDDEKDHEELEKIMAAEIGEKKEEEAVYIPPTFSQEQLDYEVAKAREEGIAEGKRQANESLLQVQAKMQEAISRELEAIGKAYVAQEQQMRMDFIAISSVIFKKLMPALERKGGFEEIKAILEANMERLVKEPSLKIMVNPSALKDLKEGLMVIAKKTGFLGKIMIEGKGDLNLSDIKVEWDQGGIERDAALLMAEIDNVVSLYSGRKES